MPITAFEASYFQRTQEVVQLTAHDGVKFHGQVTHVEWPYLLLDGLGFPLEDVKELEPA